MIVPKWLYERTAEIVCCFEFVDFPTHIADLLGPSFFCGPPTFEMGVGRALGVLVGNLCQHLVFALFAAIEVGFLGIGHKRPAKAGRANAASVKRTECCEFGRFVRCFWAYEDNELRVRIFWFPSCFAVFLGGLILEKDRFFYLVFEGFPIYVFGVRRSVNSLAVTVEGYMAVRVEVLG